MIPALWNGSPFWYPDSLEYIGTGAPIFNALLGTPSPFYGMRSEWFSLIIYPLHLFEHSVWTLIFAQAFLTSATIALCYRTLLPWSTRGFVLLVGLLCALTPVGWTADLLLPDYTGGLFVLSTYLLRRRADLRPAQNFFVFWLAVFCAVSHGSNLLLAVVLCVFPDRRPLLRVIGTAVLLQLALHAVLYRQPNLFGQPPPFVLARLVGDGTVIRYLDEQPDAHQYALFAYRDRLKPDPVHFLWAAKGARMYLKEHDPDIWSRVCREQAALCRAAVLAYPTHQLVASLRDGCLQAVTIQPSSLRTNPYVEDSLGSVFPRFARDYFDSRQHRQVLPLRKLSVVFYSTVVFSLLYLARRASLRNGLLQVILLALVANAFLTGCLSAVEGRYQARLIWLLPLCAGLVRPEGRKESS